MFEQILDQARRTEGALLVLLDEAHLLDGDALTDLRLLISSALDDAPPLKVILLQAMAQNASRVTDAILRQTWNEFQLP